MPLYEFKLNDVTVNTLKLYPDVKFLLNSGVLYYNNLNQTASNPDVPSGHISLYDQSVNNYALR